MTGAHYQDNYSELYPHEIADPSRTLKALKTLAVIKDCVKGNLTEKDVLEIGCFTGDIGLTIARHFRTWIGIDIDAHAIQLAKERTTDAALPNIQLKVMSADGLAFGDDSIDIAICSHIYEHLPNPQGMLQEIWRVLKKGGVCYFAAGNRWVIMEPHYKLPFLSYLPKPLAHGYLKLFRGRSHYYETHLTLFSLRQLVRKFRVIDYTEKIIRDPKSFSATDMIQDGTLKQTLALLFVRLFYWFFPTYIWILQK